jgi:anti-anti-sigma regulatory factor
MSIQQYSKGIILANIKNESLMGDELNTLYSVTRDRGGCDVLIDFSGEKHIVTSPSISKLLKIHKLLIEEGHNLVLFNLHESTKGTFKYAGLDGHFTFADDKSQALAIIKEKKVTNKSVSSV